VRYGGLAGLAGEGKKIWPKAEKKNRITFLFSDVFM
jgi:hypothetical protein